MAILDAFNPQTYNGGQSGWLLQALKSGLLGRTLGAQDQAPLQPQTGPTFAQGNSGMMGGIPFPIGPQGSQAQLPPNAQPTGQVQQPNGLPPVLQDNPSGFDRASAFFHNIGASKGIIPGLFDAVQGAATGQRLDPQGMQLQIMRAQVNSLMQQPGMTVDKAIALMKDPAAAKDFYGVNKLAPGESLVPNTAAFGGAQGTGASGALPGIQNTTGQLSPLAIKTTAAQWLAGDKGVLQNLGRSTMGAIGVMQVRNEIASQMQAQHIDPATQAAKMAEFDGYQQSQKTLGTRLANVSLAVNEAQQLIPQALQASANLPRSELMPINKIIQAYQENTGDPRIVKLGASLFGLVHTYARAVNPQGIAAEGDLNHATQILDKALANGQLAGGISQLMTEMQAIQKSPGAVKEEMRKGFVAGAGGAQPQQTNDPLGIR